jgi:hypothetical protein
LGRHHSGHTPFTGHLCRLGLTILTVLLGLWFNFRHSRRQSIPRLSFFLCWRLLLLYLLRRGVGLWSLNRRSSMRLRQVDLWLVYRCLLLGLSLCHRPSSSFIRLRLRLLLLLWW